MPIETPMDPMLIAIPSEATKLASEIGSVPEQHWVQVLASNRASGGHPGDVLASAGRDPRGRDDPKPADPKS